MANKVTLGSKVQVMLELSVDKLELLDGGAMIVNGWVMDGDSKRKYVAGVPLEFCVVIQ